MAFDEFDGVDGVWWLQGRCQARNTVCRAHHAHQKITVDTGADRGGRVPLARPVRSSPAPLLPYSSELSGSPSRRVNSGLAPNCAIDFEAGCPTPHLLPLPDSRFSIFDGGGFGSVHPFHCRCDCISAGRDGHKTVDSHSWCAYDLPGSTRAQRPHLTTNTTPLLSPTMFRHGARTARTFATSARLAAAAAAEPSQHLLAVSKAQGIAKGLTGGMSGHTSPAPSSTPC